MGNTCKERLCLPEYWALLRDKGPYTRAQYSQAI